MDIIGIVFLVIIGLYFVGGCKKGFIINLLESIKTILVFIFAFVFCKEAAIFLLEGSFGASVITMVEESLLGTNEIFATIVNEENKTLIVDNVWEYVFIPSSFDAGCQELVNGYIEQELGLSIGYYIAKALAYYTMISLGFIGILIVGSLLFSIFILIFKKIFKKQGIFSRLLGGIVGIVRGIIFVSILCYIISIVYQIAPSSSLGEIINNSLNSDVGIFRWFYENNLVSYLLGLILKSL